MSWFRRKAEPVRFDPWTRKQQAAQLTDSRAYYYGGDGTIHNTGTVDVEVCNGEVVSVWFRCKMIPFRASEVSEARADNMRSTFQNYNATLTGVELID